MAYVTLGLPMGVARPASIRLHLAETYGNMLGGGKPIKFELTSMPLPLLMRR